MPQSHRYHNGLYVIYGPPGAGKSTAVEEAISHGFRAFDLEHLAPDHRNVENIRLLMSAMSPHISLLGAADMQILKMKKILPFAEHVLILPDRFTYLQRREWRDRLHPHKANQPDVYDAFHRNSALWDIVVSGAYQIPLFAKGGVYA